MADQKVAKPALQAALHLAVAGRVPAQRGAQVGAARVPAAQGALDVRRAQVVLELGFRERAQERAVFVAGGEVQEGAWDGGRGKAAVEGGVAGRRLPLTWSSRPSTVRRQGTASVITEGGSGMMRQRQAAVP